MSLDQLHSNWVGSVNYPVREIRDWSAPLTPQLVAALGDQVRAQAQSPNGRVRFVGKTHSFSDVLLGDATTVIFKPVNYQGAALLPLTANGDLRLAVPNAPKFWVRFDARATIRACAREMWLTGEASGSGVGGLAFANEGGFSGQTVGGAVMCSTHGSGVELGPLCDSVDAFDFVGPDGNVTRVQHPSLPLTEADFQDAYGARAARLLPDQHTLDCARVSMGEFGVCVSVVVRVLPAYKLSETKTLSTFGQVNQTSLLEQARASRHFELWLSPNGEGPMEDRICVVARKEMVPVTTPDANSNYVDTAAGREHLQDAAAVFCYDAIRRDVYRALDGELRNLELTQGPRIAAPDTIYDIGQAGTFHAVSTELVFDATRANHVTETYLQRIADNLPPRPEGLETAHTGWFSLRFVKASESKMSMFHGGAPFCTVELPMICGKSAAVKDRYLPRITDVMMSYQRLCNTLQGRFHWAQFWKLTRPELQAYLEQEYPDYPAWRAVQQQLGGAAFRNPAFP